MWPAPVSTRRSASKGMPQPGPFGIRAYRPSDEGAVVELSLRAWAPVFASLEAILGSELFVRLHGDWRRYQEAAVRKALGDQDMTIYVADTGQVVGFVAARIADAERRLGEIYMLAVDPESQRHGVGTALTEHATSFLRDAGMRVAMIATGGDPGHAAARRVYEKAAYTPLPTASYFKSL